MHMVRTIMLYSWGGGGGQAGLHIEMAMLAAIGAWLGGSGWTSVMTIAGVTTEGSRGSGTRVRFTYIKGTMGSSSFSICFVHTSEKGI